jgi:hypothetical protein
MFNIEKQIFRYNRILDFNFIFIHYIFQETELNPREVDDMYHELILK